MSQPDAPGHAFRFTTGDRGALAAFVSHDGETLKAPLKQRDKVGARFYESGGVKGGLSRWLGLLVVRQMAQRNDGTRAL